VSISGADCQILVIGLAPNEEVVAQPGSMMWCNEGIVPDVGTGALAGLCTRCCCAQENMFRVHWKNMSPQTQRIGLTNLHMTETKDGGMVTGPGKIIPMNLDDHGGQLMVSKARFMAAMDPNVDFSPVGTSSVGKAGFGGQGFFRLKLSGRGMIFLNAYGTVMERDLRSGETIVIDQMALVAWAPTVTFSFRMEGGLGMLSCGGEGWTNTTLTGPGRIVLHAVSSKPTDRTIGARTIFWTLLCLLIFGGPIVHSILSAVMGAPSEDSSSHDIVEVKADDF